MLEHARGSPPLHSTQALLKQLCAIAVFHDHLLHGVANPRKLQPITKALTCANDGIKLCLSGRIRKCQLQPYRCAYRDGAGDESTNAAATQAVGPAKGGIIFAVTGK